MRRRIPCRVCSCTPGKGIVQIEARCLVTIVNREIRRLECMKDLRRKGFRALRLGNICFYSGHPYWAIRVWRHVSWLIECGDYDEWRYADWDDRWYFLDDMTAEPEARELARRADDAWKWMGHPEMADCEAFDKSMYDGLWLDKYDYDRNEPDPEDEKPDSSLAVFDEGLPYWRPLFTQSIYVQ